jgi:hypothetical protein
MAHPKGTEQSRCGLSVTNGSCDVLQTVVFEPSTARSRCTSFGIGDEVWDTRVEARGPISGHINFIAGRYRLDSGGRIGKQVRFRLLVPSFGS